MPPRARLDSLKNPLPRPRFRAAKKVPEKCINPDCDAPDVLIIEDNKLVCEACGVVADDAPDLVTDLQYGVSSSTGQHVVHGHHVGADAAYAHGSTMSKQNRQMSTMEQTHMNGRNHIEQICQSLGVNKGLKDAGMQVFRLAASINFIQGRRTKSVAAVSLYIACRTQREEANEFMLIDFADELKLNVFHLGGIYQDLIKELRLNPNGLIINPINPEDLILRFTRRLEFDKNDIMKVANDAVRIVQRMNRDWMTPGRRPAGICGAALILAARMNNYRRTTREMVYVVKVNEMTISKRLDEFKVLDSSNLTVDEFRTIDLERNADPPAFNPKPKRLKKTEEFDDDGDEFGDNPTPEHLLQAKRDRQSMPPPPIPIDPNILDRNTDDAFAGASAFGVPAKRKRGRPRKDGADGGGPADESSLTSALTDPFSLTRTALQSALEASRETSVETVQAARPAISISQEIGDDEFEDDPEVANCLLGEDEIVTKTRIWTAVNADWIRDQASKALKHQIAVENGTYKARKLKPRKRRRMGDLRQYAEVLGEGDEEEARRRMDEGEAFSGAAEAVEAMMRHRNYSSKINYAAIRDAYAPSSAASSRRTSVSGIVDSPGAAGLNLSEAPGANQAPNAVMVPPKGLAETPEARAQQQEIAGILGELEKEGIYAEGADDAEDDDQEESEIDDDPYVSDG